MKITLLLSSMLSAMALVSHAAPILIVGTPGNSLLMVPIGPSPNIGPLINFDALTPFSAVNPTAFTVQGVTSISSPDGLLVEPFSTQSFPNELYDNSGDGTANISISLASGVTGIGIGVADSDPVSITLQALNSSGVGFGSLFSIDLTSSVYQKDLNNPFNFYFVLSDTTKDIFGMQILQTSKSVNYSGLAIDDLRVAPEPASFTLLVAGISLLGLLHWRRRA